jgi:uncharacterized protein YprB with RNaseH-like and TPR domain
MPSAPPDPGFEPLVRLERSLLGQSGTGLSLRERLERLIRVASAGRGQTRARPAPRPLPVEQAVPNARVAENARGRFVLVEDELPLDRCHGHVSLSRFRALCPGTLAVLAGEPSPDAFASFRVERTAFLDTETTGLAGGAGTAAFLVGAAWVRDDRLLLRQYVMRDYDEEPAMLQAVADDLRGIAHLVTFNGRGFDLPLLEARYRLNRARLPAAEAVHLDLLPPVRRLWGERFESCRLQSLEAELLGLRRTGDVPGEEIPRLYFEWLRSRNARGLAPVLEHNRLDVVSLAALLAFCCAWIEDGPAGDAREHYGLARVFERAAVYDRSEAHYRRVVDEGQGPLRVRSLRRLAARAKRARDHAAALPLWEEAARAGDGWSLRELAVHHEHRSGDLQSARRAVEEALRLGPGRLPPRLRRDLQRRQRRLQRKLGAPPPGRADPRL